MQATRKVSNRGEHALAYQSMVTLARASMFMSWEQKQTINKLRERLTVRDSQLAVSTEKSDKQDQLITMSAERLQQQNKNIRTLKTKVEEL